MCLECLNRCLPKNEAFEFHRKVEKQLKEARKIARREVKILLLGTGMSGKSTFMKQMRILHEGGFHQSELVAHRKHVFHNTVSCMQIILAQMTTLGIEYAVEKHKQLKLNIDIDPSFVVVPKLADISTAKSIVLLSLGSFV